MTGYLKRLQALNTGNMRSKGSEQTAKSTLRTLFTSLSAHKTCFSADPGQPSDKAPGAAMTEQERAAVLRWLASIGETDPGTIAAVLERCSQDAGARCYFVGRAAEAHALPTSEAYEEQSAIMEFDAGLSRPEAEHAAALDVGCVTCAHFARPGLSAGYCGGRDDLPRAYGENHPLRKLPSDRGAACKERRLT